MTTVATFEIGFSRCLDQEGKACGPLPDFAADEALLKSLYRGMVLSRAFDAKAIALQRTGRLGTFASCLGQEAVGVGAAAAMRPDDVLLPSFREHGAMLARGVTLHEAFLFWGGDERGSDYSGPRQDFPISVPVGSHAAHAAGVALAMKLRGEARAAVCVLGDGATSKGDVYEAMNLAAAWTLPLLFVVSNNQWAISLAREGQTAAETLAQKAIASGFDGEQVDGNDVIAVHAACLTALEKARRGGGAVTKADVERVAEVLAAAGPFEELKGVRRAMARNMTLSGSEVVPAAVTEEANVDDWAAACDITVRLVRAVAAGVAAEPALNAWYDAKKNGRRINRTIDLGIAVDSADGLFVPVLRDVAKRDAADLRAGLDAMMADVKARTVPAAELRGQTITLSNFGTMAGLHSNLVVVPPQVAILGAGRLHEDVVARQGAAQVRRILPLSLSFDHRVVTGGEAARFLAAVKADLEEAE